MTRILSDDELKIFHRDGYVMVKNFFSKQEIDKLYNIAIEDKVVKNNAVNVTDKKGKNSKLTLWFTPGDDIYSCLLRSERMVYSAAKLLESEAPVCHFHTRLMKKNHVLAEHGSGTRIMVTGIKTNSYILINLVLI